MTDVFTPKEFPGYEWITNEFEPYVPKLLVFDIKSGKYVKPDGSIIDHNRRKFVFPGTYAIELLIKEDYAAMSGVTERDILVVPIRDDKISREPFFSVYRRT